MGTLVRDLKTWYSKLSFMQIQTLNSGCITELKACKRRMRLMGNQFEITVVTANSDFADYCIDAAVAEISRIERSLTTFNDLSQTNLINQNAGVKPVRVDKEVYDLIARSIC